MCLPEMRVSIIVSAYNTPRYLRWCLSSITWLSELPHEVIVADDGSGNEVTKVVEEFRSILECPLLHSWISDSGFRLARSRNCAAKKASGDFLLFIDGDCILPNDYVWRAKKIFKPDRIINGARKLLTETQTKQLLAVGPSFHMVRPFFSGRKFWKVNLPFVREIPARSWSIFRGFSMGIPRGIFDHLSGFNEAYRSWGLEDSDFAVRALREDFRIRDGRYALTVLHMHHPEPSKGDVSVNQSMFNALLESEGRSYD